MKQTRPNQFLDVELTEKRLEEYVDAVLFSRRTAELPAMELAKLGKEQRVFALTSLRGKRNAVKW